MLYLTFLSYRPVPAKDLSLYSNTCLKRNLKGPEHFFAKARFPFNQGTLHIKIKQGNQRTTKEKESTPDLTFQILLK
jgi:hypothetical protein